MLDPIAVLISDVHVSLKTKEIAAQALRQALARAESLNVPLIIAGDLHDTKDMLRGTCVALIISIVKHAKVPVKVLIGNHDKVHEKSQDHALEFLRAYVDLIDSTRVIDEHYGSSVGFIPYQCTNEAFLEKLKNFKPGQIIICHQGFKGAFMGEYVKDESSVHPDDVADFRVISGHYHRHQDLQTITYIGTPYTTSFAEANDGPKGYVILNRDGTLEQVPTNLRKHVIIETTIDDLEQADETGADPFHIPNREDLVWLKVSGPSVQLDKLDKRALGIKLLGHQNFKLDKLPTDSEGAQFETENLTDEEIMDVMISQSNEQQEQKEYLCALWRELLK